MGTMLQAQEPTLEDFQDLEGCNEVLNVTRPDIVRSVHEEYFAADDFVVLFLGSGYGRKGLGPLLQAFASLSRRVEDPTDPQASP